MIDRALRSSGANTVLEALRSAHASVGGGHYKFTDWTHCTCGHIYRGAVGRAAYCGTPVQESMDDVYRECLQIVIEANPECPEPTIPLCPSQQHHLRKGSTSALTESVSFGTSAIGRNYEGAMDSSRAAARHMLERAIKLEEDRNETARLKIVAGSTEPARRIVVEPIQEPAKVIPLPVRVPEPEKVPA